MSLKYDSLFISSIGLEIYIAMRRLTQTGGVKSCYTVFLHPWFLRIGFQRLVFFIIFSAIMGGRKCQKNDSEGFGANYGLRFFVTNFVYKPHARKNAYY